MSIEITSILSAIIGGLLVFGGQWLASRQHVKTEAKKWELERQREIRQDIVRFREQRTKPVFEALDRAAHAWDVNSMMELAKVTGYEFEVVDPSSEEYKKQAKESKRKYVSQLQDDICATATIHDEKVRNLVANVLWQSPNSDADERYEQKLHEAYSQLENWIFNPTVESVGKVTKERQ